MRVPVRRKGAPLIALSGVLVLWIGVRAAIWESPFLSTAHAIASQEHFVGEEGRQSTRNSRQSLRSGERQPLLAKPYSPAPSERVTRSETHKNAAPPSLARPMALAEVSLVPRNASQHAAKPRSLHLRSAQGGPPHFDPVNGVNKRPGPAKPAPQANANRWSFDGWVFVRPDNAVPGNAGPFPASYGASQMGGVLRYRLASRNSHRPNLYLRATGALSGAKQADLAVGVAARPARKIPLSVQLEARMSDVAGRPQIRPAAFVVTEIPPTRLPLDWRGEMYAQGGYVGGDFATAFIDGQARLDRGIGRIEGAAIRAGAGVWGGAQKGAARLDVGPTASIQFNLEGIPVRLSADYRRRVAGDAVPQSGIAFTLSTGF